MYHFKKTSLTINKFFVSPYLAVHLICGIYCSHGYSCRYDSIIFCFRKLKVRRLIFLINYWSNLKINIVSRTKKTRNGWWTMSTLAKENVLFDSKPSLGHLSVAEGVDAVWLIPRELQRKHLKFWSWETYKFLWNM